MRDILFRGKWKGTNVWLYGELIYASDKERIAIVTQDDHTAEIEYDTAGQYTGLQDKKGNRIFEGDVVHSKRKNYLITFRDGMFYASVEECNEHIYGGFPLHALTTTADDDRLCEIVGNRYDNPNLIINNIRNGRNRKNKNHSKRMD